MHFCGQRGHGVMTMKPSVGTSPQRASPPSRTFITNVVGMAKGFGFGLGPKML